jgi:hypothetical protein
VNSTQIIQNFKTTDLQTILGPPQYFPAFTISPRTREISTEFHRDSGKFHNDRNTLLVQS